MNPTTQDDPRHPKGKGFDLRWAETHYDRPVLRTALRRLVGREEGRDLYARIRGEIKEDVDRRLRLLEILRRRDPESAMGRYGTLAADGRLEAFAGTLEKEVENVPNGDR